MQFKDEVEKILGRVQPGQRIAVSATFPPTVMSGENRRIYGRMIKRPTLTSSSFVSSLHSYAAVASFMGGSYTRVGPGWPSRPHPAGSVSSAETPSGSNPATPSTLITHRSIRLPSLAHTRTRLLLSLLSSRPDWEKVLVFAARKSETEGIAEVLRGEGVDAEGLHGDLSQGGRERR